MEFFGHTGFISFIVVVLLEQVSAIYLWFGSDRVKISDIRVITVYAGRMTKGRKQPAVPQIKCVGGNAGCNSYVFETMQCYNRGTDGFQPQWECKAAIDSTYYFGRTDVTCEGYDYLDDPYVLRDSCGVEYTLNYRNGGNLSHVVIYFIWGAAALGIIYFLIRIMNESSGTNEIKIEENAFVKPRVDLKQPVPESRTPFRVSGDQQKTEIQLNNRRIQNTFVRTSPAPDINNNIIQQEVIVTNNVESVIVKNQIQPVIKNEQNYSETSNLGASPPRINIGQSTTQQNPCPEPANCNYIIVNNTSTPVSTNQSNNCQPGSRKPDATIGGIGIGLASLILMARARNSGPPPPAASKFGTHIVSGFGGTKRR